jgi:hypothetical protein
MIVAPFMHHVTLSTMAHQADVDVNALIPVPEPEGAVELTPELTNHSESPGKPRCIPPILQVLTFNQCTSFDYVALGF